ncbi:unnamed protein product, partial [Ascophyllum nodosum]
MERGRIREKRRKMRGVQMRWHQFLPGLPCDQVCCSESSGVGWRKKMEDAHVALLDLPAPETDTNSKIRLFGRFLRRSNVRRTRGWVLYERSSTTRRCWILSRASRASSVYRARLK